MRGRRGAAWAAVLAGAATVAAAVPGVQERTAAPGPQERTPATGTVVGRIVDAETSTPLGGVQVSVQDTRIGTLTNPEGRFLLMAVPEGERVVVFRHPCYHRTAVRLEVEPGRAPERLVGLGMPFDHERPESLRVLGACPR